MNKDIFGIDFGTRYSCVSIWKDKKITIVTDRYGNRTFPSMVSFYKSIRTVGYDALKMKETNVANTITDIKRIIGLRFDDQKLHQQMEYVPYTIVDDGTDNHNPLIQLDPNSEVVGKLRYKPEEIASIIFSHIKSNVERSIGKNIVDCVITVPAYYGDAQRQAIMDSAKIAQLNVMKIINEPTAAALAYGLVSDCGAKNIIVYDLGAGTLDVSFLNIDDGVFKVLAVSGNSNLGGEDFDYVIASHVISCFRKQHDFPKDMRVSKLSYKLLKEAVECAKKILSTAERTMICVENFYHGKDVCHTITREDLENICIELFILAIKPLQDVIESSGFSKNDVDDIVLVGGSSRIPKIKSLILDFFRGTKINTLNDKLNPDEVVSTGASIYGYILKNQEDPFSQGVVLLDVIPLSLGVEVLGHQMVTIIPRNTIMPVKKKKIFSTDTDDQDSVIIKIYQGERKLTKNNFLIGTFELTGFAKALKGVPVIYITFDVDINGILHVTAHEKNSKVENTIKITNGSIAKGRLTAEEIDNLVTEAKNNEILDGINSSKIEYMYNIREACKAITINLSEENQLLTEEDKKKIMEDVSRLIKRLENDLSVNELKKENDRIQKIYAPFIMIVNQENMKFKDDVKKDSGVQIHGDDEEVDDDYKSLMRNIIGSTTDTQKEEIKKIKNDIVDLCNQIISIMGSTSINVDEIDRRYMKDYIDTVLIWIFSSTSTSMYEYIAKINEINEISENIIKKYKDIFTNESKLSKREELEILCLTLSSSLETKYISLKQDKYDSLQRIIKETTDLLLENDNLPEDDCKIRIDMINHCCNEFYQNTCKYVEDDDADDETESQTQEEEIKEEINITPLKITENLDKIIDAFDEIKEEKPIMLSIPIVRTETKPVICKKVNQVKKFDISKSKKTKVVELIKKK